MFEQPVPSLDRRGVLAATERRTRARRAGAVKDIRLVLAWCDLNTTDPQREPGAVPVKYGGDRLVTVGGDGTPMVAQLSLAELAIARHAGVVATENHAGDCLDLRHRFPLLWAATQRLEAEPWVALKIARMARDLARDRVGVVDTAVAAAIHQSPGRLLGIAEAKIIEADPDLHRTRLEADASRTGVRVSRPRPGDLIDQTSGEPATRRITAKLPNGTAIRCAENIDDLAHALLDHATPSPDCDGGDVLTLDQARQWAFELLTTEPHAAARFLDGLDASEGTEGLDTSSAGASDYSTNEGATDGLDTSSASASDYSTNDAPAPRRKRRPAELVVHVTGGTLCGCADGLARVEDYGPVLVSELRDLLGADRDITVQPVIDLDLVQTVNGYEHPTPMRRRTLLRTGGDVFPHSTSRGLKRLDIDHPVPYDPKGPPGQTSDRNAAPLTRRHHRVKTHHNYQVTQLGLAAYRWITPHGLCRVVTPHGTRVAEPLHARDGTVIGEAYHHGPRILIDFDQLE